MAGKVGRRSRLLTLHFTIFLVGLFLAVLSGSVDACNKHPDNPPCLALGSKCYDHAPDKRCCNYCNYKVDLSYFGYCEITKKECAVRGRPCSNHVNCCGNLLCLEFYSKSKYHDRGYCGILWTDGRRKVVTYPTG